MSDVAVRVAGLVKDYGTLRALDGIDLEVREGEVFGFIGPNGAGKSTTIRILLDLLRPTAGTVRVLGEDPSRGGPALRARLGYLPGELVLPGNATARQLLGHASAVRGGRGAERIASLAPTTDPHIADSMNAMVGPVQFVLDGSGKILRILANPNAFNGDQPRTLRGSPFLAEQVQIPTGSIQRAPRQ